ncbi:hypothetical protein JXA88_06225 [Candidatus Fermentibacteria bacterium]|nr:hypothetical protein [Candidatus Fermentibacteria bacterium]
MRHPSVTMLMGVLLLGAPGAGAIGVTVGGFGGYNVPILQDDVGPGPLYGMRVKLKSELPFVLQPYFAMVSEGDVDYAEEGIEFTQEGGSFTSFGLDLAFGGYRDEPGISPYFVVGIGAYSRDPGQKYRETLTSFGVDLGFGVVSKVAPMLDFDLSARVLAFMLDEGGSRKSLGIAAGLNYYFAR